jgi:hypothetical protein
LPGSRTRGRSDDVNRTAVRRAGRSPSRLFALLGDDRAACHPPSVPPHAPPHPSTGYSRDSPPDHTGRRKLEFLPVNCCTQRASGSLEREVVGREDGGSDGFAAQPRARRESHARKERYPDCLRFASSEWGSAAKRAVFGRERIGPARVLFGVYKPSSVTMGGQSMHFLPPVLPPETNGSLSDHHRLKP